MLCVCVCVCVCLCVLNVYTSLSVNLCLFVCPSLSLSPDILKYLSDPLQTLKNKDGRDATSAAASDSVGGGGWR